MDATPPLPVFLIANHHWNQFLECYACCSSVADPNGRIEPVALADGPLAHIFIIILEPTRLLVSAAHSSGRTAHEHNAEPYILCGTVDRLARHHCHDSPRDRPRTPYHLIVALFCAASLRVLHPQDLRTKDCDDGPNGTVLFILLGTINA